jgi:group I intron endonuclease
LQNAWIKYGENNFIFEAIEKIEDEKILVSKEQEYIDKYKSYDVDIGYNINKNANSRLGTVLSEETKRKISDAQKGEKHHMYGKQAHNKGVAMPENTKKAISKFWLKETNGFYGKKHTQETKEEIRLSRSKLNWELVKKIREKISNGESLSSIANEFGVSKSNICYIKSNKIWTI